MGPQSKFATKVEEEDASVWAFHTRARKHLSKIAALDIIETLKPRAVIAGQKKAEKVDNREIIEETRQEWLTVVEIFREKGNT